MNRVLGPDRVLLAESTFRIASMPCDINSLASNGVLPGQQFVQQHTEAVDIAARINV